MQLRQTEIDQFPQEGVPTTPVAAYASHALSHRTILGEKR